MEKIFHENRALVFTSAKAPLPWAIQKEYKNMDELTEFAKNGFRRLPNYSTVCLDCHGMEEKVYRDFIASFPVVEASGGLVRCPKENLEADGKEKVPSPKEAKSDYLYLYIYRNSMWDLPKGKKEKGETDQENALREVEEETGMKHLKLLDFIKTTYHFIENKQGIALKKSNWFGMEIPRMQATKPQTEEGITQAVWIDKEGIRQRMPLMYASIAYLTDLYFGGLEGLSK